MPGRRRRLHSPRRAPARTDLEPLAGARRVRNLPRMCRRPRTVVLTPDQCAWMSGPGFVLLHGLGGSSGEWDAGRLAAQVRTRRVHASGSGIAGGVGHSFGAVEALRLAANEPWRVRRWFSPAATFHPH